MERQPETASVRIIDGVSPDRRFFRRHAAR
jgi:hypothetical protein